MITPQQLAEALDEAEYSGVMEAVGALLYATHPERAAMLRNTSFPEPQKHVRARADALLMIHEMGVTDPRIRAAVIVKLHGPAQVYRIATGTGLKDGINSGGQRLADLICKNPERKAAHLALLRLAMVTNP